MGKETLATEKQAPREQTEPPKEWYMNKCMLLEKEKKALEDKIDALEKVLIILTSRR